MARGMSVEVEPPALVVVALRAACGSKVWEQENLFLLRKAAMDPRAMRRCAQRRKRPLMSKIAGPREAEEAKIIRPRAASEAGMVHREIPAMWTVLREREKEEAECPNPAITHRREMMA
jgi:hypothetical protein